jgi:hypothetical protein
VVNKAIVIENKIMEMESDGKRKVSFHGKPSGSNLRPRFTQPNQFFKSPQMNRPQMPVQVSCPQFFDAATEFSSTMPELPDAEASTAASSTQRAARPPL